MLSEKYRPRNLKEYVGQQEAKEIFVKWIKSWKSEKALMFHGPPGVGKTSLVEAYASENGIECVETNASDFRSATELKSTLSGSVTQRSLFKRGKIFLIDEIDGISGYEDRGGVGEIINIINESKHPIVLVANDPYNPKLRSLRQHCHLVKFRKLSSWEVEKRLSEIAAREKINLPKNVISLIARKSNGDLRSAINDLQTVKDDREFNYTSLQDVGLRERESNIFEALRSIFKSETALAAKKSINNVEKDPDEIFWWIENNIAAEYEKPEEIAKAFEMLSVADVFRRRIYMKQNWKLLAYMIELMTGGVATAKESPYRKFTRYQYPSNIMLLGSSKAKRTAAKEILSKMSKELHCSPKKILTEYIPYFKIISENSEMFRNFADSLNITREELDVICG